MNNYFSRLWDRKLKLVSDATAPICDVYIDNQAGQVCAALRSGEIVLLRNDDHIVRTVNADSPPVRCFVDGGVIYAGLQSGDILAGEERITGAHEGKVGVFQFSLERNEFTGTGEREK